MTTEAVEMTGCPGQGGDLNPSGSSHCSLDTWSLPVGGLEAELFRASWTQRGWALARGSPAPTGAPRSADADSGSQIPIFLEGILR